MNFSDIKAIQQIADSNIDPRAALVQQAGDRVLQEYHGSLMFPLVATLGAAGYCMAVMASPPLAIAAALLGGFYMVDKVQRGERAFDDIENGRLEKYLNEQQRRVLKQLAPVEEPAAYALPAAHAVDVAAVPVGKIAAPPISAQWNGQQWQLWERMVKDCPDLRFTLMAKLVVVSGPQQTGKSSLGSAIAYLRAYLLGWPTIAITPHVDGATIFDGEVIGSGQNFAQIQQFYTDMKENFSMGGDRRSLVVDELTQYTDEHEKLGQSIVRTALSETDKHGFAPILINHAQTVSAGFAGIKGVAKLIENSAVQLTRQYEETEWGEQTRSSEVKLSRLGKPEVSFIIPDWLHLPALQKQYPMGAIAPVKEAVNVSSSAPENSILKPEKMEEPPNPFQLTAEILERLYEASPDEEEHEKPLDISALSGLSRELQAIIEFAHKRNDWIKAKDIRGRVRLFRNAQYSPDDIRLYFCQLAEQGLGTVDGEGESLRYRF